MCVTTVSEGMHFFPNNRVQMCVTTVSVGLYWTPNNRIQMCVTTVLEILCSN